MTQDDITLPGGLSTYSVKYYSADVEASWQFDDEDLHEPSLQVVYKRDVKLSDKKTDHQNFWLYLSDDDAIAIGSLLLAWGETQKRAFEKLRGEK